MTLYLREQTNTAMARMRLILGGGDFGRNRLAQDIACFSALDTFISKGFKEVDGALMYSAGECDKMIGKYRTTKNNDFVVASKVNPWGEGGLSRSNVLNQVQRILDNLQTKCVDILYLHAPDHKTPVEETLAAIQHVYEEGKFKELGLCNFASWEVVDIHHICKNNGWVLPTVYQGMYNPVTRMVEAELFPALRHLGMRFYAYNPTACGMLTGKYRYSDSLQTPAEKKSGRMFIDPKWSPMYRERYWRESMFEGIELVQKALDSVYGEGQVSLLRATLRWMCHHSKLSPNDGVVLGASCVEHVAANVDACQEGPLDTKVVDAFDLFWQQDKIYCVNYFR